MVRKIKGYTLFEVLIIIALIGILSSLFIREILVYVARERLKTTAEEFAANLNLVKTKSMISLIPHGFCYDNSTNSFIFFVDNNFDNQYAQSESIVMQKPASGISFFSNLSNMTRLTCPNALFFDRRGEVLSDGVTGFTITFSNNYGEVMSVILNSVGRINIRYGS